MILTLRFGRVGVRVRIHVVPVAGPRQLPLVDRPHTAAAGLVEGDVHAVHPPDQRQPGNRLVHLAFVDGTTAGPHIRGRLRGPRAVDAPCHPDRLGGQTRVVAELGDG